MFGEIVGHIKCFRPPKYGNNTQVLLILDPIEVHRNGFGAFLGGFGPLLVPPLVPFEDHPGSRFGPILGPGRDPARDRCRAADGPKVFI